MSLKFADSTLELLFLFKRGPWPDLEQGSVGRPDSGAWGRRRRGPGGGKARGGRALPRGGFGWGWDGRSGRRRGEGRPAADWACGGGVPAGLGGGAWVGEYQRKVRKLTAGSNGREGGRRRELRGSLWGGGGRSRRKGARGAGLSSLGGEKGGRGRL